MDLVIKRGTWVPFKVTPILRLLRMLSCKDPRALSQSRMRGALPG